MFIKINLKVGMVTGIDILRSNYSIQYHIRYCEYIGSINKISIYRPPLILSMHALQIYK